MKVVNLQRKIVGPDVIFSADFFFASLPGQRRDRLVSRLTGRGWLWPYRVWFRVQKQYGSDTSPEDTFFILAYLFAAAQGEDLEFGGEVSKQLFENIRATASYLKLRDPDVEVAVKGLVSRRRTGQGIGQLFTLGVDSFFTLLAGPMAESFSKEKYLIFVEGFDVSHRSRNLIRQIHTNTVAVAESTSTKPVFVATNVRPLCDRVISWDNFHGAALAAVGLLLGRKIGSIYINATDGYRIGLVWGTSLYLDRLWSTEAVSFLSSGADLGRMEKVEKIKESRHFDLFLQNVRVCGENYDQEDAPYNCSRCTKCVFTQFVLLACDIRVPFPSFGGVPLADLMPGINTPFNFPTWEKIYHRLKAKPEHRQLAGKLGRILQHKGVLQK